MLVKIDAVKHLVALPWTLANTITTRRIRNLGIRAKVGTVAAAPGLVCAAAADICRGTALLELIAR